MSTRATERLQESYVGFLTVCEQEDGAAIGGYLILNGYGRPMEFHCTAPLKPNRAQEILYGPTLRPYLYGEQIAGTLLQQSELPLLAVCTDSAPVVAVRDSCEVPVVLVNQAGHSASDVATTPAGVSLLSFQLHGTHVAVSQHHAGDRQAVEQSWDALADSLDLSEPFARIREAIAEAQ